MRFCATLCQAPRNRPLNERCRDGNGAPHRMNHDTNLPLGVAIDTAENPLGADLGNYRIALCVLYLPFSGLLDGAPRSSHICHKLLGPATSGTRCR